MHSPLIRIRGNLDRFAVALSGLCAVHCVATLVLVAGLGLSGGFLLNPLIHDVGLALAMIIAAVAIGSGALRHRRPVPFVIVMAGLTFMGGALAAPEGIDEAILTVIGVSLVAIAHVLNVRHMRGCNLQHR